MADRIVAWPMYAVDRVAVETFWRGLRGHILAAGLGGVPDDLEWPDGLDAHWRAPDLLLSQTCGYPLTHALAGEVRYVATPRFHAPGCQGALYSSVIVVRDDDRARDLAGCRGRRVAFNSRDSQSGFHGLRAAVAPLAQNGRFFSRGLETGSHRASLAAVQAGEADVAAIDAVTFALVADHRPGEVEGLRPLVYTDTAPGLPLITARGTSDRDLADLRRALAAAGDDPGLAEPRAALRLGGFEVLPEGTYQAIPAMSAKAAAAGYATLA